jgi:hypothetical protein
MVKFVIALFLFVAYVTCDLYMHNPRGSNDRLNEANTNRDNANRLFDSQNNAKGGYCLGPQMTFYEGSFLSIEWTVQHGCGSNPKLVCNMVIQYMCGSTTDDALVNIRDGTTTNSVTNQANAQQTNTDGSYVYGMHESYQSYADCTTRQRNFGLYIADRSSEGGLNSGRQSSIFTRQNNNGEQFGFECTEERDYYPYWHPSQWRDIAILAHDTKYCDFYRSNSQNVQAKGYCQAPGAPGIQTAQNNPSDCQTAGNQWTTAPSFGISPPSCVQVPWSRENHLGNGMDGFTDRFNMTFPTHDEMAQYNCIDTDTCVCVLRIRYNISTVEDGYPDMSNPDSGFIDWTFNGAAAVIYTDPILNYTDPATGMSYEIQLAVDTTQFGRTFQDRSFTYKISQRPHGISSTSRIYNLNVRGKRGNIVQTNPATEYDFVPQYLYTRVGDYIHFQWTGCDTNPAGNAGEGTDQTDRSNMVQILNAWSSKPVTDAWCSSHKSSTLFTDPALRFLMAELNQVNCSTQAEIEARNGGNNGNAQADVTNCGKLNAASPYFNAGLVKLNQTGTFHYMNTRNHNFSNRDQKGILYVVPLLPNWALGIVIAGSILFVGAAVVAGMMFYAKSHPHSSIANIFSKM